MGQAALERDLEVLKTISRERDNKLGIGALVPGPGRIAIGDKIAVARTRNFPPSSTSK